MALRPNQHWSLMLLAWAFVPLQATHAQGTSLLQVEASGLLAKYNSVSEVPAPEAESPSVLTGVREDESPSAWASLRLRDGFRFGASDVADIGEVASRNQLQSRDGHGVLCQTLLHQEVHDQSFMPFAESGIGEELAAGLDKELKKKCQAAFEPNAWEHLFDDYTGSWTDNQVADHDNKIFGSLGGWINDQRAKIQESAQTWDTFRNSEEGQTTFERLVRHIASGEVSRILDFGCGDGVELAKTARSFGLGASDTFGIDVDDRVSNISRSNFTFLHAPLEVDAYAASLEALLNDGVRGTVTAIITSVTFHHITEPAMRTAALNFVKEALSPDGFFLFAEWDNSRTPIDFTIYFDLAHFLPILFFNDPVPTTAQLGPLQTEYLSVQGWIDLMKENGLVFDEMRSSFPFKTEENQTVVLGPKDAAERSSGRNFLAVFGKVS